MINSRRKLAIALGALGLAFALAPAAASAASITVSSGADDNPTNGAQNSNGVCTLREAIQEANANNPNLISDCSTWSSGTLDNDTINLAAGTYTLDEAGASEDSNATGDLDPSTQLGNLTIQGAGAGSTLIDTPGSAGGWGDRVFDHDSGGQSNTSDDQGPEDHRRERHRGRHEGRRRDQLHGGRRVSEPHPERGSAVREHHQRRWPGR